MITMFGNVSAISRRSCLADSFGTLIVVRKPCGADCIGRGEKISTKLIPPSAQFIFLMLAMAAFNGRPKH